MTQESNCPVLLTGCTLTGPDTAELRFRNLCVRRVSAVHLITRWSGDGRAISFPCKLTDLRADALTEFTASIHCPAPICVSDLTLKAVRVAYADGCEDWRVDTECGFERAVPKAVPDRTETAAAEVPIVPAAKAGVLRRLLRVAVAGLRAAQ